MKKQNNYLYSTSYYEESFNYKKFLKQFILRSEFIGFGILTPFYAILGFFVLEIPPKSSHIFFLTALFTAFLVVIYVVISTSKYLKPIKKFINSIYNNTINQIPPEEKYKLLRTFFQLPIRQSIDAFIRTTTGVILFTLLLNFFIEYDFYKIIVTITIFFMFGASCGISYYMFLEDLISKIINSNVFRTRVLLEEMDKIYFFKYKYTLSYLLFLAFFMISSLSGFVASQFGEYWSKELHQERVHQKISNLREDIHTFFMNIQKQLSQLEKNNEFLTFIKKQNNTNKIKIFINSEILKDTIFMDYALFDNKNKEILFSSNYFIQNNEFQFIREQIENSSGKTIITGFRLTSDNPHRILIYIKPYKDNLYHILFINLANLEQRYLFNNEQSIKNIFLIIDRNLKIIASTEPELRFQELNNLTHNLDILKQDSGLNEKIYFKKFLYELFFEKEKLSEIYIANLYAKSLYQEKISFSVFILATTYMLIGILFIFFIIYLVNKKTKSLELVNTSLDLVAKGNFKKIKMLITNDEFGSVSISLIKLKHNLRNTLKRTIEITNLAKQSSEHFKQLTDELVNDSENEAATTEQISATIEEISATMDKISEYANEQTFLIQNLSKGINELTMVIKEAQNNLKEIKTIINESEQLKNQSEQEIILMTEAMNQIQQTSSKITNIISIVREIADQINLLSLNASIEAARAGEYGKGFAVVADEVSKLADKTMNSIKDINLLIKNSNEQIHYGINITNKVKNILSDMIKEFQRINQLSLKISEVIIKQEFVNTGILSQTKSVVNKSNEIQSSINEQKLAIKEITESIASINKTILNSTENARKINTQAKELENKIKELETLLQYFNLDE
ncbi:MAG: methyl-accepting chemotaxis protein [Leptospiraceae bacterium]|nr:MAG: methyl-accepting chemotaxis protein [Leptospiraceae bacterium]